MDTKSVDIHDYHQHHNSRANKAHQSSSLYASLHQGMLNLNLSFVYCLKNKYLALNFAQEDTTFCVDTFGQQAITRIRRMLRMREGFR